MTLDLEDDRECSVGMAPSCLGKELTASSIASNKGNAGIRQIITERISFNEAYRAIRRYDLLEDAINWGMISS